MAKRGRAPKASRGRKSKVKSTIQPEDFRYPGELRLYWTGVGGIIIIFAWLAVACIFLVKNANDTAPRWDVVAEVLFWPIIAVLIANILSTRGRQKEFKQRDAQSRVLSSNYPDIFRALGEFAKLAGLKKAPDMYILDDDRSFIFSMPVKGGTIVASRGLREGLRPQEFLALVAHEMGHIVCKHVRMELAIIFIRGANPVLKLVLLPVTIMSLGMGAWLDAVDYSCDRCAYLMTGGNGRLVNAAVVKLALLWQSGGLDDAQGGGAGGGIGIDELDTYLSSTGDLARDEGLMELQVRAGHFVASVPNLRDRIEALREYVGTDQEKTGMEKVTKLLGLQAKGGG